MAVKNKQDGIIEELTRRIESGFYEQRLPAALKLAEEFNVNFKTMNRAILRMAEMGLVTRQAKKGTFIVKDKTRLEDTLIELIFVGSSDPGNHPFYSQMWQGILDSLNDTVYKLVLNRLDENTQDGGLLAPCKDFTPSAGKILIGSSNPEQIRLLKKSKTPFVLAGSKSADPTVLSVYADPNTAINSAIQSLRNNGISDIAYIGITRDSGELAMDLDKFHSYLAAIQKEGSLNSDLVEHASPFAANGYPAMKKILERKIPQAVVVAYDHLCPGVYQAIEEHNLEPQKDIEVIGIDGGQPLLNPPLKSIIIDRYEIGKIAGELLLDLIRTPSRRNRTSTIIPVNFPVQP